MHELLADLRALATSLANGGGFARNLELGMAAFSRSPQHAVLMTTQNALLWLARAEDAWRDRGLSAGGFPVERLEATIPLKPRPGRPDAARDALAYLQTAHGTVVPDIDGLDRLIKTHGLLALSSLMNLANECGRILVDADPGLVSLNDLFEKQALADEKEWREIGEA